MRCFTKRLVYTYKVNGEKTIRHCTRPRRIRLPKRKKRVPAGMTRNRIRIS